VYRPAHRAYHGATVTLGPGERTLYHQVHPLKLATDISTAIASLILLGQHRLWLALAVMFGPSIVASAVLVRFGDFSRTRDSRVGAYLRRYMTKTMQGVRLLGMGIAAAGAWVHAWWTLPAGAAVIAWGWAGGWLLDRRRGVAR
jgi:hypothetical protein